MFVPIQKIRHYDLDVYDTRSIKLFGQLRGIVELSISSVPADIPWAIQYIRPALESSIRTLKSLDVGCLYNWLVPLIYCFANVRHFQIQHQRLSGLPISNIYFTSMPRLRFLQCTTHNNILVSEIMSIKSLRQLICMDNICNPKIRQMSQLIYLDYYAWCDFVTCCDDKLPFGMPNLIYLKTYEPLNDTNISKLSNLRTLIAPKSNISYEAIRGLRFLRELGIKYGGEKLDQLRKAHNN
jgi:hypothetical protein